MARMNQACRLDGNERLRSIDALRGLVMILMALDHTRDFWGLTPFSTEDPAQTTFGWFLTRWVTHFCAPVFVLLTGTSAYLYGAKGRSNGELSRYLVSRGLWLILLEITVVNFAWRFALGDFLFLAVIWAIGISMILLAGLLWLPRYALLAVSLVLIAGHNALDYVTPDQLGGFGWVWTLLHVPGYFPLHEQLGVSVAYPIVPWCGVMALGYVLGPLFLVDREARFRGLLIVGGALALCFIVLRACNGYGDPISWAGQTRGWLYTVISFFQVTKYPPSLHFICMTLGPAFIVLMFLERSRPGRWMDWLCVFGRVPLFFYLLHIPVLRFSGLIKNHLLYGANIDLFAPRNPWPEAYVPRLWIVYLAWTLVIVALFPACRWFAQWKREYPQSWWTRYF